jgi:hypothetical protein
MAHKISEETRRKMSASGMGRITSEATKQKLSGGKMGTLNPMFGTQAPNRLFAMSRDELYAEYVTKGRSLRSIADGCGVKFRTVQSWLSKYEIALTPEQHGSRVRGPKNGNFVGYKDNHGYVFMVDRKHPLCSRDGYVASHRLVVEKAIGRHLTKAEQVHHLNFEKADNDIFNLALFASAADHTAFHKWMDRVGAFSLGLIAKPPVALKYASPVLLRGKWVNEISVSSFWAEEGISAVA